MEKRWLVVYGSNVGTRFLKAESRREAIQLVVELKEQGYSPRIIDMVKYTQVYGRRPRWHREKAA